MDVFTNIYVYTYISNNNRGHEFKRYKEVWREKREGGNIIIL